MGQPNQAKVGRERHQGICIMPKIKSSTTLSMSVIPISGDTHTDQDIDGLLSGVAWNLPPDRTITYSFPDSAADYGSSISGFQPFNHDQQTAVRTILDGISAI